MSLIDPGRGRALMKNSDSLGRSIIKSRRGKKIANNTSQLVLVFTLEDVI